MIFIYQEDNKSKMSIEVCLILIITIGISRIHYSQESLEKKTACL